MKKEIEKIADKLVYAYKKNKLIIQYQLSLQKILKMPQNLESSVSLKLIQKWWVLKLVAQPYQY